MDTSYIVAREMKFLQLRRDYEKTKKMVKKFLTFSLFCGSILAVVGFCIRVLTNTVMTSIVDPLPVWFLTLSIILEFICYGVAIYFQIDGVLFYRKQNKELMKCAECFGPKETR